MTRPDAQPLPIYGPDNPYPYKSECFASCGDCCKLIALKGGMNTYRFIVRSVPEGQLHPDEDRNARFIVDNMIEIPIELAVQMNARRVAQSLYHHFYVCSAFDQQTGLCRKHDERPPMCRNFPFVGLSPYDPAVQGVLAAYPRCSYWHEYPRDQWPEYVDPADVFPNPTTRPENCC